MKIFPAFGDFVKYSKASLTSTTTLHSHVTRDVPQFMTDVISLPPMDFTEATNSVNRTMRSPHRVDYRHRFYCGLEPAHRVAYDQWLKFGILSPFSAFNGHLNFPNRWLYTTRGELCLNDNSSATQGWEYVYRPSFQAVLNFLSDYRSVWRLRSRRERDAVRQDKI